MFVKENSKSVPIENELRRHNNRKARFGFCGGLGMVVEILTLYIYLNIYIEIYIC